MKIGLLGLPEAGKRTLFMLLTGRTVPENRRENESIEGIAPVRDPRVDVLNDRVKPEKMKYAETVFELCPDITTGTGKREWLETARQCDLLCMVVRAFSDESVYHPDGSVDAARDMSSLKTELMLADYELIEKRLERIAKEKRSGRTPEQELEEKTLERCKQAIESEKELRTLEFEPHEMAPIRNLGMMTLKPLLWTFNCDEKDLREDAVNPLTIACKIELEIMGVEDPAERAEFLKDLGLKSSGVDRMNRAAYDALGLMSFYTIGKDEVRAWTIRKGAAAPVAAGKIHSDIQRGFIRVEVIKYDDLVAAGTEAAVREQGRLSLKGKDYVIEDGDICHFFFNV
jgi:GTP-binding protein YchF